MNEKGENLIVSIIGIVIIFWIGSAVINFFKDTNKPDRWYLVYLNHSNATVVGGMYETRQECSQKLNIARNNPNMNRPECGLNCEKSDTFTDMYVCEETFEF